MIDLDKLPDYVVKDIAYNLGAEDEEDVDDYRARIATMSARQAFSCYCNWNGLMGYGNSLFQVVTTLQIAESK